MTKPRPFGKFLITASILPMLFLSIPLISNSTSKPPTVAPGDGLSIILMIGDGMGSEHIRLGRWVEVGPDGNITMDTLPYKWSITTHNMNEAITDSAAAATALATGNKTLNGMLGMTPLESDLFSILEIAESMGKSTGLISTTSYYHATPAGFFANTSSRYNYDEITRQLVEENDIEVILSGGNSSMSSIQQSTMQSNGYTIVQTRSELDAVTSGKVLGLFGDAYMSDELTRDLINEPSLAEMTNKSLDLLSQDIDGFFLMVEGGRIDWSAHDNDQVGVTLEAIAFDKAVNTSLQYVKNNPDTILIVTADHETGGLTVISNILNDELPSSANSEAENRDLRIERSNNVTVSWIGTGHTGVDVPLFLYGNFFAELPETYTIDNTQVFLIMRNYFLGSSISITDFTTTATTTTTTTTITTIATSTTTTAQSSTSTSTTTTADVPPDMLVPVAIIGGGLVVFLLVAILLKRSTLGE